MTVPGFNIRFISGMIGTWIDAMGYWIECGYEPTSRQAMVVYFEVEVSLHAHAVGCFEAQVENASLVSFNISFQLARFEEMRFESNSNCVSWQKGCLQHGRCLCYE
jgi:hypothetical protein